MLALVTCSAARALDTDLPLLLAELPAATVVTWDDHTVDWSAFDAVVLRSTWDYHAHLQPFLDWARSVAAVTALWNAPRLIEWNIDKRYLLDLAASGVPIVPTRFVAPGDDLPPCRGDVVVKPAVGAGSVDVRRFGDDPAGAHGHIDAVHARGAVAMVQPYQSSIDEHGETGLVFVGGAFSHALRKEPILAAAVEWEAVEGASAMFARERVTATNPSAAERDARGTGGRGVAGDGLRAGRSAGGRRRSGVARAGGRRAVTLPAPRPRRPGARGGRVP